MSSDARPAQADSSNAPPKGRESQPIGNGHPRPLGGSADAPPDEAPTSSTNAQGPSAPPATDSHAADRPAHHRTSELKDKITDKKQKIKDKAKPPGGFDATPLPEAPPGYTVKFTFHRATGLPVADIHTTSADPFIHATLTAGVPRRHKEDPVLRKRTRTIQRSTEPEWDEDWIVSNVPASGFKLKCRLYDEDHADHDDRLGNVTVIVHHVDEAWEGIPPPGKEYRVKKRAGSKRAYLLKACSAGLSRNVDLTPRLILSIQVLGRSEPPYAQMCTIGPLIWFKHYSPMVGRIAGIKVNQNEAQDEDSSQNPEEKRTQKYDFQANEIQLQGPVPPKLYHRFVEFRPVIGKIFSDQGFRGRILSKALHTQHARIYNFDASTEWGTFKPCSNEATLQFLKMAHFDEGGRLFTYVLTLDGLLRFTETGKEFGIDLLSKHTMHSDIATYIACSGEFFIRRLKDPTASPSPKPKEPTHPPEPIPDGPPGSPPPREPRYYQLVIDNDSGTYRPDKCVLPDLKKFLERNFPGLGVVAMDCGNEQLQKMKEHQGEIKKKEGRNINMVMNRSPSTSSFSSSDESDLEEMATGRGRKSKKEKAWDVLEDPKRLRTMFSDDGNEEGEGSKAHAQTA